jgi:hypothetical protein
MKRSGVRLIFFSLLRCIPLSGCKAGSVSESWLQVLDGVFSPQAEQLQSGSGHLIEIMDIQSGLFASANGNVHYGRSGFTSIPVPDATHDGLLRYAM